MISKCGYCQKQIKGDRIEQHSKKFETRKFHFDCFFKFIGFCEALDARGYSIPYKEGEKK
jgi:hypothetical protein